LGFINKTKAPIDKDPNPVKRAERANGFMKLLMFQ
jgi:hypothetical protein